ncbi:cellulose binding domain-containing protein [Saccharothrix lopnurensis]|uniref:Cellulose binding domain-containing protein n=1 Tax=Saccharothrix lopnurensis TaxID=1670621 RepID=A0ABW1NZV3_9PSEU
MRFRRVFAALLAVVGGIALATPAVAVDDPPAPRLTCRYEYTVVNAWQGGYQVKLKVTNLGPERAAPWYVNFELDGPGIIAYLWGGSFTQLSVHVRVNAPSWNRDLYTGQYAEIEFAVNHNGSPLPLTGVSLNAVRCAA